MSHPEAYAQPAAQSPVTEQSRPADEPKSNSVAVRSAADAKSRSVAPDFARGIALWGIALANVPTAWITTNMDAPRAGMFGGTDLEQTPLEQILIMFHAMFVHVRGLPMFSTLLGVGVGMIAVSLWKKGYTNGAVRRVLARRYFFLFLFGAVHAVFLFFGDIMSTYGLAGILCGLMVGLRDKLIKLLAGILFGLNVLYFGMNALILTFMDIPDDLAGASFTTGWTDTYPGWMLTGLISLPFLPFSAFMVLPMVMVGFLWGRQGVFRNIDKHSRKLWAWTGVAAAVILLIGVPWGLSGIGVIPDEWFLPLTILNQGIGTFTGPGILAAIMLALRPVQRKIDERRARGEEAKVPGVMVPFVALGKRSMSGYLAQSILFFILVLPFTFGLGRDFGIPGQMLIATGVWLATLLGAWAHEAAGKQGPFEWLHRRLSYGKGLQNPYQWTAKEIERARQGKPVLIGYPDGEFGQQQAVPSGGVLPVSPQPMQQAPGMPVGAPAQQAPGVPEGAQPQFAQAQQVPPQPQAQQPHDYGAQPQLPGSPQAQQQFSPQPGYGEPQYPHGSAHQQPMPPQEPPRSN